MGAKYTKPDNPKSSGDRSNQEYHTHQPSKNNELINKNHQYHTENIKHTQDQNLSLDDHLNGENIEHLRLDDKIETETEKNINIKTMYKNKKNEIICIYNSFSFRKDKVILKYSENSRFKNNDNRKG